MGVMKGLILFGDKGEPPKIVNLRNLAMQTHGKVWVCDRHTETEIRFKLAPMGGHAGMGNYLKQWRKRNKFTQAEAAKELGFSQSMIAKIENGGRTLPVEAFQRIHQDNTRNYGRR